MKAQEVTIDLELLGARFAHLDSKEQAAFFHGLAKELSRWESDHMKELQFFYVRGELSEPDLKQLDIALGALSYKEETQ